MKRPDLAEVTSTHAVEDLRMLREGDPVACQIVSDTALHAASTTPLDGRATHPAGTRPASTEVHYAEQAVLGWALRLDEAYRLLDAAQQHADDPIGWVEFGAALEEWHHCRDSLRDAVDSYREALRRTHLEDEARYDRDRGIGADPC